MQLVTLRASDFDPHLRVAAFQEAVASICKLEFRPDDPGAFRSETTIAVLPGLVTGHGLHSSGRVARTARLAAETGDNVMIHVPAAGGFSMQQQGGAAVECRPGLVYLDPNEVPGRAGFHGDLADVFYLSLPRAALEPAAEALGKGLRGALPLTPAWRILVAYARALHQEAANLTPDEAARCVAHVQELALLALGDGRHGRDGEVRGGEEHLAARSSGLRAARLKAVKADIARNLANPELSPAWLAARHGISERYLRALFAAEGTAPRDHIARSRLELARSLLADPAHAGQGIAAIALEAGFGDLSWFNARFKAAFGERPSDIRAQARATSLAGSRDADAAPVRPPRRG